MINKGVYIRCEDEEEVETIAGLYSLISMTYKKIPPLLEVNTESCMSVTIGDGELVNMGFEEGSQVLRHIFMFGFNELD